MCFEECEDFVVQRAPLFAAEAMPGIGHDFKLIWDAIEIERVMQADRLLDRNGMIFSSLGNEDGRKIMTNVSEWRHLHCKLDAGGARGDPVICPALMIWASKQLNCVGNAVAVNDCGDRFHWAQVRGFGCHADHERKMAACRTAGDDYVPGIDVILAGMFKEPCGGVKSVRDRSRRGGLRCNTILDIDDHESTLEVRQAKRTVGGFFAAVNPAAAVEDDDTRAVASGGSFWLKHVKNGCGIAVVVDVALNRNPVGERRIGSGGPGGRRWRLRKCKKCAYRELQWYKENRSEMICCR